MHPFSTPPENIRKRYRNQYIDLQGKSMDWFLYDDASNFIKKEILAQVFSSEFCEIFKNTLFCRTPPVTASYIPEKSLDLCSKFDKLMIIEYLNAELKLECMRLFCEN